MMNQKDRTQDFFTDPDLEIYFRLSDKQLLHYNEPVKEGLFIAESPKVIHRALDAGYIPVSILAEDTEIHTAESLSVLDRCKDIPVYVETKETMGKLMGYPMTRGMLCAMKRKPLPSVESICKSAKRIVILEDVMNPTNLGAIFRSAAALGMDGILLTPGCCDPLYRRAIRVSMGTVFQIPWTILKDWPHPEMDHLKALGFTTAAMALKDDTLSIDDPVLTVQEKLAVVLGTEGEGLATSTIADCDYTVKIPMAHGVDSLNVAAAGAVAFWELSKCDH